MQGTKLILQHVSEAVWNDSEIAPFVKDARAIERRLPKEVNLSNERMRYQLCCRRIQEAVLRMEFDKSASKELGVEYFDILRKLYTRYPAKFISSRISSCFFPPDILDEHIKSVGALVGNGTMPPIIKCRLDFLEEALKKKGGVVEYIDFLTTSNDVKSKTAKIVSENRCSIITYNGLSEENISDNKKILISKIEKAITTKEPVNFTNQPHRVITEVLNHFVYKEKQGQKETYIKIIYMDGSEAEPFPVWYLDKKEEPAFNEDTSLKASLVSMRHLAMDDEVDFAWFRNRKVSSPAPFAEIDAYCTAATIEVLKKISKEGLILHLYQTGLETAVIGFYRGLVQILKNHKKNPRSPFLKVVPYYKGTEGYKSGTSWF